MPDGSAADALAEPATGAHSLQGTVTFPGEQSQLPICQQVRPPIIWLATPLISTHLRLYFLPTRLYWYRPCALCPPLGCPHLIYMGGPYPRAGHASRQCAQCSSQPSLFSLIPLAPISFPAPNYFGCNVSILFC